MIDIVSKIKREAMKNIIDFDIDQGKSAKGKSKFLASQFLKQINNLIEELYSSDCHFVRCIKPN
jgi:myosin heavy subunit